MEGERDLGTAEVPAELGPALLRPHPSSVQGVRGSVGREEHGPQAHWHPEVNLCLCIYACIHHGHRH